MKTAVLLALAAPALADVYMHNPRGSNNRYDTTDANDNEVNNNNRLFDSQDNDDGGYDIANPQTRDTTEPMRYYEGSNLVVQWTAQHACGKDSWINCEYILQYQCGPQINDGQDNADLTYNNGANNGAGDDYGVHETWNNYYSCDRRNRNKNLYISDRMYNDNLNADDNDARFTRQNNNGNRQGFECPEERDYYPYWAPSEWIDIAILTNDVERCPYYYANTQNTHKKWTCVDTADATWGPLATRQRPRAMPFITEAECVAAASSQAGTTSTAGVAWVNPQEFERKSPWFVDGDALAAAGTVPAQTAFPNAPFWGAGVKSVRCPTGTSEAACAAMMNAPECIETRWSRDNHLGGVVGGYLTNYTWRIPAYDGAPTDRCVLRLRYNMSSDDYDGWNTDARKNVPPFMPEQDPYFNYNWQSQPVVLALDTNQYGRTFQDRSHTFKIIKRAANNPPIPAGAVVHNINVLGKRGHVTQNYPSINYDFTPQFLTINRGDFVHFQWEGSSTVRTGYMGGGRDRTERHNLVQIKDPQSNWPLPPDQVTMFGDPSAGSTQTMITHFAMAGQEIVGGCAALEDMLTAAGYQATATEDNRMTALNTVKQRSDNCMTLNRAPEIFWSEAFAMSNAGIYSFMSTRDNWPGLQNMKGQIVVK